jgi:hypothetical protein
MRPAPAADSESKARCVIGQDELRGTQVLIDDTPDIVPADGNPLKPSIFVRYNRHFFHRKVVGFCNKCRIALPHTPVISIIN